MTDKENAPTIENAGRRKAVKAIVGSITAIAAYNMLPAKWDKPVIESVFLPAHAATSGVSLSDPCSVVIRLGTQATLVYFTVSGSVIPATNGLPVDITINTTGGPDAGTRSYPSSSTNLVTDANGEFSYDIGGWGVGTQRIDATTTVQEADGSASCGADVPLGGQF